MANNSSTEPLPVLPIEDLPYAMEVTDDSKFPVSQNGKAMKVLGTQIADFARESAAQDVQRAVDAADAAEQSVSDAKKEADRSKSEADRAAALRESIEADYEVLYQAVEDSGRSAACSKSEADRARSEADRSGDSAVLSESWAVGGTGARQGEDENNSKYWADKAQVYAEQAKTPVDGVYNIILTDIITTERYALIVDNGRLKLIGVADDLEATNMLLIDRETGISYAVIVEDGRLGIEEAV